MPSWKLPLHFRGAVWIQKICVTHTDLWENPAALAQDPNIDVLVWTPAYVHITLKTSESMKYVLQFGVSFLVEVCMGGLCG